MKYMYLLDPHGNQRLSCCFEYYEKKSERMQPCGKSAIFKLGRSGNDGICRECAISMLERGYAIKAPNGVEYTSLKEVLEYYKAIEFDPKRDEYLELRKYVIGLYDKVEPVLDYARAHIQLKFVFKWLQHKDIELTEVSLREFVRKHYWLIYKSGDPFWSKITFSPHGVSLRIFEMICKYFQVKEIQHKTQVEKDEQLESELDEIAKGGIYDPDSENYVGTTERGICKF